jgi:hypothetical protein
MINIELSGIMLLNITTVFWQPPIGRKHGVEALRLENLTRGSLVLRRQPPTARHKDIARRGLWRDARNDHRSCSGVQGLVQRNVRCAIHETQHGSDHQAIETVSDPSVPALQQQERLLLRNAPWSAINANTAHTSGTPRLDGIQPGTNRLMSAVLEAVYALAP